MSLYLGTTPIADGASTALLADKADVDLSNVNASGTSLASSWSMPSTRYENLTLGASDTTYTAPANGWFVVVKKAGISGSFINAYNSRFRHYAISTSQRTNETLGVMVPVKKGDNINISYNATGNTTSFKFVYAEGEN